MQESQVVKGAKVSIRKAVVRSDFPLENDVIGTVRLDSKPLLHGHILACVEHKIMDKDFVDHVVQRWYRLTDLTEAQA